MTSPSLSIIIPVLNEEKYLPTLLTDLSRQTYTDFEVIVVDGQSKDRTVEKANHFAHRLPKFTILKSDLSNVCHQRNQGAAAAAADLILFMDADNRLPTYFLQGLKYRIDLTEPDILPLGFPPKKIAVTASLSPPSLTSTSIFKKGPTIRQRSRPC